MTRTEVGLSTGEFNTFSKVCDISPNASSMFVNVRVQVVRLESVAAVPDSNLTIAEALVGDETGCILLRLHHDQISSLPLVGQSESTFVTLTNARVSNFRGYFRLEIDRHGAIECDVSSSPVDCLPVSLQHNMSDIKYKLH